MASTPSNSKDSTQSFSVDEAYHSCSVHDDTDESSYDDLLDNGEEETQIVISAESLQIHYKYLLHEMEPQCLIDYLHQSDIFSDKFLEECSETKGRIRRNDLLIKEVFNISKNRDATVLQEFIDALNITEQSFIVDQLLEQSSDLAGTMIYTRFQLRGFTRNMKDRIELNIEPRDFIDDLVVKKAISFHEHEDITRLDLRKKRVSFIMKKVKRRDNGYESIIKTILETYPKLFDEELNASTGDMGSEVGQTVSIRLHLKSGTKSGIRPQQVRMSLRQIESQAVERFNTSQVENREMDALVEECRCKFEGLKISSVVILLLTQSGFSLEKVLRKVQSGKAVDWLLSILNEKDKQILRSLGVTKLQVSVSVDEGKKLNTLFPVRECICRLNKHNVRKNKKEIAAVMTDIRMLIQQMSSFDDPMSHLRQLLLEENSSTISQNVLDYLVGEEVPPVLFCLLEEHIKARDQSFLEHLLNDKYNEDTTLLTSDIKLHEDFLKDELELNSFIPVIRTLENVESVQLLEKLRKCSSRNSRMAEFIRFLLSQDNLTWFWEKVKEKYKYVWDTLISSKQTTQQSKTDLLAAKMMNDIVIEEVNPLSLKQYMREATINDLGFNEFETLCSRKLQAQYMMKRLRIGNICDLMVALNRAGYDCLFKEIKAGSLAKHYLCPLIHAAERRIKQVFKKQFDLSVGLNKGEIRNSEIRESTDREYMAKIESWKVAISPKPRVFAETLLTEGKSPAGWSRVSESGFYLCCEEHSSEISDENDFDDEDCLSISPGSSVELASGKFETDLKVPNSETRRVQKNRSRSSERGRTLRLIDSDMSVSRSLLKQPFTKRLSSKNYMDADIVAKKTSDGSLDSLSKRMSRSTEERYREREEVTGTKTSYIVKPKKKDDDAFTEIRRKNKKETAKTLLSVFLEKRKQYERNGDEYGHSSTCFSKTQNSSAGSLIGRLDSATQNWIDERASLPYVCTSLNYDDDDKSTLEQNRRKNRNPRTFLWESC